MELIYDLDGNVTSRRVATGPLPSSTVYTSSYSYDDDYRLSTETDPAGKQWSFYYDSRSNLQAVQYPNGTFSWQTYNNAGWKSQQLNRHGTLPANPTSPLTDANALADFNYSYFQNGQRASEQRTGQGIVTPETTNYSYDPIGRLSTVSGSLARSYCYDLDSNRSALYNNSTATCGQGTPDASLSYSATALDQLTSVTKGTAVTNYGYTGDGQVSSRGSDTLNWDGRGRLSGGSFTPPGSLSEQFTVDGTNTGSPITTAPFNGSLNTTTLSDGWHTIGATVTNENSKTAAAPSRVVKVQNTTTAPGIALRTQLGTANNINTTDRITLTITAAAPVGDTVIVAAGQGNTTLTSVTDSRGNTYTIDRPTIANGSGATAGVAVASTRVTTALQTGDTITAIFASTSDPRARDRGRRLQRPAHAKPLARRNSGRDRTQHQPVLRRERRNANQPRTRHRSLRRHWRRHRRFDPDLAFPDRRKRQRGRRQHAPHLQDRHHHRNANRLGYLQRKNHALLGGHPRHLQTHPRRHHPTNRPRQPRCYHDPRHGQPLLDGINRQRWGRLLPHLPLNHLRLHARYRQRNRTNNPTHLHRQRRRQHKRTPGRHLLLQTDRPRPVRQPVQRFQPSQSNRHRQPQPPTHQPHRTHPRQPGQRHDHAKRQRHRRSRNSQQRQLRLRRRRRSA